MNSSLFFSSSPVNINLIRQLGHHYADYRLYPQIEHFNEGFDAIAYTSWLNDQKSRYFRKSLSLHINFPLRDALCRYQFSQILSKDDNDIEEYLYYLTREIELQAQLFEDDCIVEQIYFGGGAFNILSNVQLNGIIDAIEHNFNVMHEKEQCIEIDASLVTPHAILQLKDAGFNYAMMGINAFDQAAQQSIHHFQSEDRMVPAIWETQSAGFRTIRVELTYGWPEQTLENFLLVLNNIIAASPHQIRLLNYPYFYTKIKPKQRNPDEDLLAEEAGFEMLTVAMSYLTDAGYVHIGMNHFASSHDQLVIAQRQGRLYYGLQGYSIHPNCTRVALGISAVGSTGPILYQNFGSLQPYYGKLKHNKLPIMHGHEPSADDLIRRSVMQALICHSVLSYESVETFFSIEFKQYFAPELASLRVYEQAGMLTLRDEEIAVTPTGQLWVGNICRVFDRYLRTGR
ncbi:MAG: oxygen-independent coproporphyrinogen III oxidase [Nitrosomonas sp.]|nr:oxygen-independent coproporphyrinogen III oxidase [Nitrosomonas sp.]